MTKDEAEAVARAIGYADGGCITCTKRLAERLNAENLGWEFKAGEVVYERVEEYDMNEPRVLVAIKPSAPPPP